MICKIKVNQSIFSSYIHRIFIILFVHVFVFLRDMLCQYSIEVNKNYKIKECVKYEIVAELVKKVY